MLFLLFWPFMIGLLILASLIVISFWTRRTLTFWLSKLKKKSVVVPFWLAVLASFVFNGVALSLNVISELVRLVVK